jgi:hypothetical protein
LIEETAMMKRIEFAQAIQSRLDRKPFRPFAVELEDGQRRVVEKRESISYLVGNDALYVHPNGEWEFLDRDDVMRVVDLAPEHAPAT